jgi:glycosyltransferase involved in cell wall biosynthesis
LYDILQGTIVALWLCLRYRIKMVHARSYISALIGLFTKKLAGTKLLFDMRGLWADERTDGGIWPENGRIYRTVKALERHLLLQSDHVVTLTHASETVIANFPYMRGEAIPISVIPTCADLDRFAPQNDIPKSDGLTLGYLGSIGTWYMFDEVLECFKLIKARQPNARMLVLNRLEQDLIEKKLAIHGIDRTCCEITSATHAEVPKAIARMDVGAAIIKPVFSKIASAPTKLAEYLGCGIPCLGNVGVGDMEMILEHEGAGVALTDFSPEGRQRAIDRLFELLSTPSLSVHCRDVALKHFSLRGGVDTYRGIYRSLLT